MKSSRKLLLTSICGLPAGSYAYGNYADLGTRGLWWTSTEKETDPNSAFFFNLSYDVAAVYDDSNEYGLSIRCVRN